MVSLTRNLQKSSFCWAVPIFRWSWSIL